MTIIRNEALGVELIIGPDGDYKVRSTTARRGESILSDQQIWDWVDEQLKVKQEV